MNNGRLWKHLGKQNIDYTNDEQVSQCKGAVQISLWPTTWIFYEICFYKNNSITRFLGVRDLAKRTLIYKNFVKHLLKEPFCI